MRIVQDHLASRDLLLDDISSHIRYRHLTLWSSSLVLYLLLSNFLDFGVVRHLCDPTLIQMRHLLLILEVLMIRSHHIVALLNVLDIPNRLGHDHIGQQTSPSLRV
jgi:hypothetical protein